MLIIHMPHFCICSRSTRISSVSAGSPAPSRTEPSSGRPSRQHLLNWQSSTTLLERRAKITYPSLGVATEISRRYHLSWSSNNDVSALARKKSGIPDKRPHIINIPKKCIKITPTETKEKGKYNSYRKSQPNDLNIFQQSPAELEWQWERQSRPPSSPFLPWMTVSAPSPLAIPREHSQTLGVWSLC